jgi:hypothetical protein
MGEPPSETEPQPQGTNGPTIDSAPLNTQALSQPLSLSPSPLTLPGSLLLNAWDCYDEYNHKSNRLQVWFKRIQLAILLAGVAAVLLVAMQKQAEFFAAQSDARAAKVGTDISGATAATAEAERYRRGAEVLHWMVLCVPLLLSGLIAAAHTFRPGDKWVLLRGGAEAVKRQIFRFRTRTGDYAGTAGSPSPEQVLFERLSAINDRLKQSEVSKCALEKPKGEGRFTRRRNDAGEDTILDDGVTPLTPERYLDMRINDQINFYSDRTRRFDRRIIKAMIATLVLGAVGTLLAAARWELWIPVATVAAAAFTTYLRYTQSEETLITYNRARIDLKNVYAWWNNLTLTQQAEQANFNTLVDLTEKALEEETTGWSQRMTDALTELTRKQTDAGKPLDDPKKK